MEMLMLINTITEIKYLPDCFDRDYKGQRGAWMAQLLKHLPLSQVIISGSWD